MSRQPELRVLVCGSDQWYDVETIREVLRMLPKRAVIVQRGQGGADWIADMEARDAGLRVRDPEPGLELSIHRERREAAALDHWKPAFVVAFLAEGDASLDGLLEKARERGARVRVFRPGWRKGDAVEG